MCDSICNKCVYYYEETDFCLHDMYNVMRVVKDCENKRSREDYPATTLISHEDLEFSDELTDCWDEDITIYQLFQELKAINAEYIDY